MQTHPPEGQVGCTAEGTNRSASTIEERIISKLFRFGIAEIILGLGSIVLAVVALGEVAKYEDGFYLSVPMAASMLTKMAAGIWCGMALIITGVCGILAKIRWSDRRCIFDFNASMSLISALLEAVQLLTSIIAAAVAYDRPAGLQVLHGMLALLGFVGMIVAAWHMACSYPVSCCRKKQRPTAANRPAEIYIAPPVVHPQHYVQLANGQVVALQMQPLLQGYPINSGVPVVQVANTPHQVVYVPVEPTAPQLVTNPGTLPPNPTYDANAVRQDPQSTHMVTSQGVTGNTGGQMTESELTTPPPPYKP